MPQAAAASDEKPILTNHWVSLHGEYCSVCIPFTRLLFDSNFVNMTDILEDLESQYRPLTRVCWVTDYERIGGGMNNLSSTFVILSTQPGGK